jgi:hypothetical protein
MHRASLMFPIALLVLAAAPSSFGGWTVITIHDLPEYLVAGESTTLAFTIRQHGQELLPGRSPTVTLKDTDAGWFGGKQRFAARAAGRGVYEATITPEETGEVEITVDADFHGSRSTLLPMRVLAAGGGQAALPVVERGRQLFVAKGCATCHTKRDDPDILARNAVAVGPDLTGRELPVEWLAAKLADPAKDRVRTNEDVEMPNLGLDEREIAALVSYVNGRELQAVGSRE